MDTICSPTIITHSTTDHYDPPTHNIIPLTNISTTVQSTSETNEIVEEQSRVGMEIALDSAAPTFDRTTKNIHYSNTTYTDTTNSNEIKRDANMKQYFATNEDNIDQQYGISNPDARNESSILDEYNNAVPLSPIELISYIEPVVVNKNDDIRFDDTIIDNYITTNDNTNDINIYNITIDE